VLFHKIIIGGGLSLVEKVFFHWKGLEQGISPPALGVIIINHHYLNYSPLSLSKTTWFVYFRIGCGPGM
jgi:hypothetical protein